MDNNFWYLLVSVSDKFYHEVRNWAKLSLPSTQIHICTICQSFNRKYRRRGILSQLLKLTDGRWNRLRVFRNYNIRSTTHRYRTTCIFRSYKTLGKVTKACISIDSVISHFSWPQKAKLSYFFKPVSTDTVYGAAVTLGSISSKKHAAKQLP